MILGGLARGQVVEISGPDSSGKTSLCLSILAEASQAGEFCAYIDADLGLTMAYVHACGVDSDHVFIAQSNNLEAVLDMIETFARSGGIQLIVLDSLGTLVRGGEPTDLAVDPQPKEDDELFARFLSRLKPVLEKHQVILLVSNTEFPRRSGSVYHNLAKNTARLALKLHAATRLQLTPHALILIQNQAIGERVNIRILKNGFASCCPSHKLDIMYNNGINKQGELLDLGVQLAIIQCETSCYSYRDLKLGESYSLSVDFLKGNPTLSRQITQEIRQKLFPAANFIFPLLAAKA